MLSYRLRTMRMGPNHIDDDHVSPDRVLTDYVVAPTRMTSTMHMLSGMIGLSESVNAMIMIPVTHRAMTHVTRAGGSFETSATGLGDLTLVVHRSARFSEALSYQVGLGVGLPTGSTSIDGVTPMSDPSRVVLPYPMQLGSGSFELRPDLSVAGSLDAVSVGTALSANLRVSENGRGYRNGNSYSARTWVTTAVAGAHTASGSIGYAEWGDIRGEDPALAGSAAIVPTANTALRGGREVQGALEVNLFSTGARMGGHSVSVGLEAPLWRSLNGPQLGSDWALTLSWTLMTG
jgi:hypothetical protein